MQRYWLSKRAQMDLEDIWEYTVKEWSVSQAEKYLDGLLSSFAALADNRMKGKPVEHIRRGYSKYLFSKHYIFFRTSEDGFIEIIRVLHLSMDIDSHV